LPARLCLPVLAESPRTARESELKIWRVPAALWCKRRSPFVKMFR
jgi:hypothetical protein